MNQASHNKLVSFIWSIADDCLRDVYVRGKYRDVILPMVVLRRLDTLLEPQTFQTLNIKLNEQAVISCPDTIRVNTPVIFDGRNLYDPGFVESQGIEYYAIGRGRSVRNLED